MKIIYYNGPASSGKDSSAKAVFKYLKALNYPVVFERFSAPLKLSFSAMTGTKYNEFYENEVYEIIKDEPLELLNGKTFRRWQIECSENFMKPLYGKDIFGKLFFKRLEAYPQNSLVVVPDSGFDIEIEVAEKQQLLPVENMVLFRMHRAGFDFTGDSRSYVYPKKFKSTDFFNDNLEETETAARAFAKAFVEGKDF